MADGGTTEGHLETDGANLLGKLMHRTCYIREATRAVHHRSSLCLSPSLQSNPFRIAAYSCTYRSDSLWETCLMPKPAGEFLSPETARMRDRVGPGCTGLREGGPTIKNRQLGYPKCESCMSYRSDFTGRVLDALSVR